jgi:hypothetical protein
VQPLRCARIPAAVKNLAGLKSEASMIIAISLAAALVSTGLSVVDPPNDPAILEANNACVNAASALIARKLDKSVSQWIADCSHHPMPRYCTETVNVVREAKVAVPMSFVCGK